MIATSSWLRRPRLRLVSLAVMSALVGMSVPGMAPVAAAQANPIQHCIPRNVDRLAYVSDMGENAVSVVDLPTRKVVDVRHGFSNPWHSTPSNDGALLYVDRSPITNLFDGGEDVVDLCTGKIVRRIAPTGFGQVWSTRSVDHKELYLTTLFGGGCGAFKIVDPETADVVETINGLPLLETNLSSCTGSVLWAGFETGMVQAMDRSGKMLGAPILVAGAPQVVVMTPDCKKLVALDLIGNVSIIDIATRSVTNVDIGAAYLGTYASVGDATPDSRYFWAGSYDGRLFVIDLQTGKIIHRLAPGGLIACVRVSPDGSKVYVSSSGTFNPLFTPVVLAVDLLWPKLVPGPGSTKIYDAHTYAQIGDIPTGRVPTTINLPQARS